MDLDLAEITVLEIIANNPDQYLIARDILTDRAFTLHAATEIWRGMQTLAERNMDTGTFQLRQVVKSPAAVAVLDGFSRTGGRRAVEPYCRELVSRRRMADFQNALAEASSSDAPVETMERAIEAYRATGEAESITFGELMDETINHLEIVAQGVVGIPSGMPCIDKRIGGFQGGRLVVVAARPSIGKTAITLQFCLHAARHDYPVGICSLEMSAQELGVRSMSHVYQVNVSDLFRADDRALEVAVGGMSQNPLHKWPVKFNVDQYRLDEIVNQIRIWVKRDGIRMAVVDHIGLVEVPRTNSPNERVSTVTRTLKKLAKELDIPILAVSQLNRGNEREARKPTLSNLRDSGSVEQDADICLFLHSDDDGYALGLLKNRQGPAGWIREPVRFNGAFQTFVDDGEMYA